MVFPPRDFKSLASANFAISAFFGGATQIRTGGEGFADPCLTTWLWRLLGEKPLYKKMERETRFELATFALARQRSTTEPFPHRILVQRRDMSGGNNRARTYDPLLVRQVLSQLSYAPVYLAIADIIYHI